LKTGFFARIGTGKTSEVRLATQIARVSLDYLLKIQIERDTGIAGPAICLKALLPGPEQ